MRPIEEGIVDGKVGGGHSSAGASSSTVYLEWADAGRTSEVSLPLELLLEEMLRVDVDEED